MVFTTHSFNYAAFAMPKAAMPQESRREQASLMRTPGTRVLATSAAGAGPAQETALGKFLISGGVAWLFEFCGGHYIEFLKIVKQVQPGTYLQLTKQMVAQKGIVGIWDGFFPWGSLQAVCKGGVFGAGHTFSKAQLKPLKDKGYISAGVWEVAAGGLGGGIQGMVLSPTLLLKTRVMTDPVFRTNLSMWQTTVQSCKVGMRVITQEGAAGLMKGSVVFSLKRVGDWTTRFFFAEAASEYMFRRRHPGKKMTVGENMLASIIGGTMSALATIPIDVMVAQIQQASKAGEKVSVMDTFRAQYREGGAQQIFGFATRGFVARATHVALTTALMKTGASIVYESVYGTKPAKH